MIGQNTTGNTRSNGPGRQLIEMANHTVEDKAKSQGRQHWSQFIEKQTESQTRRKTLVIKQIIKYQNEFEAEQNTVFHKQLLLKTGTWI